MSRLWSEQLIAGGVFTILKLILTMALMSRCPLPWKLPVYTKVEFSWYFSATWWIALAYHNCGSSSDFPQIDFILAFKVFTFTQIRLHRFSAYSCSLGRISLTISNIGDIVLGTLEYQT